MTAARTVACVGDVMVDVLARLAGPLVTGSDTAATIELHGGGSAANTAAWLVRAGASATLIGRVGADEFGRQARAALVACGVRPQLSVDADQATGVCLVLVDQSGERTMVPSLGANDGPLVVPAGLFDADGPGETAAHLHVSGYALLHTGSRPGALGALEQAARAGVAVSVDAASTAPLLELGAERFLAWLPSDALLLANADEARALSGGAEPSEAVRRLGARAGSAVVKLGSAGAIWSDGTQVIHARTRPLEPLDSTGAGDAFAAGLLAARLAGADVLDTLDAANRLAAEAITQLGARPGRAATPQRREDRQGRV